MVNSTYGKGRQVTDDGLKIVDGGDQSKKLRWEISGIATGTTVTMTAPTSDFNFNIPVFGVTTVDKITIDNIVIDANDISSSSGNLTITPVAGSAVVIDGGASFDGTVLTGLTALTSTAITGTLQTAAQPNITSVGALTNITPGGDFTLTHNSVNVITSVESGAIVDTLYLKEGKVGIGTTTPLTNLYISGDTGAANIGISVFTATDTANRGSKLVLGHYRGTMASKSISQSGDELGTLRFHGWDTNDRAGAAIVAFADDANWASNDTPGRLELRTVADGSGTLSVRIMIKSTGNVGIGTTAPGQIFDINSGAGNMIADGYDNHPSFFERKVDPVIISSVGYADKVKNTPVYKFKKNPFVSADELKELAITEFDQTKWNKIFPEENSHRQKALYNMAEGEMKTFIDSEADRLRIKRSTEHKNKREYCSIVLDDAGTEVNFQEVLIKDEANVVTGFNIESYIGVLHLAIQELKQEVDDLKLL